MTKILESLGRFLWGAPLLVLILGVSVIALKLLGQELLSLAASFVVCLILVLYWISFLILQRKY